MSSRAEEEALDALGRAADADIDLAGAALTLARIGRTHADPEPYCRHLAELAHETRAEAVARETARGGVWDGGEATARADALARVIGKRYGYAGLDRDFEEMDAANLTHVIDVRHGLPVALGIIYIDAARRLGWTADGVDFPGRFLVRIGGTGGSVLIDPFDGGRRLEAQDLRQLLKTASGLDAELTQAHYAPAKNRAVLIRLQNNIKARLLRADRMEEAQACIEVMLKIAPGWAPLWREAGVLHARAENIRAACAALEHYLSLDTTADDRRSAAQLLQTMKNRLN